MLSRSRGAEVVQRWCRGGAEVVQRCRGEGAEVLSRCSGSAEVIVQVQSRCKVTEVMHSR